MARGTKVALTGMMHSWVRRSTATALVLFITASASSAFAEDVPAPRPQNQAEVPPDEGPLQKEAREKEEARENKPSDHSFALLLSPLQLLLPSVELTGEVRATRSIGVSVTLGGGSVPVKGLFQSGDRLTTMKAGAAFNGYPVGHFDHGMQLGVAVVGVLVRGDVTQSTGLVPSRQSANGEGLGLFAMLGYKYTAPVGFTVNVRGGVGYILANASVAGGGSTSSATASGVLPAADVLLGWAF